MKTIFDWLLDSTSTGSTRLQVILILMILIAVVWIGIQMFLEMVREYKYIWEDESDE